MKRGGGLHPTRPDWWPPFRQLSGYFLHFYYCHHTGYWHFCCHLAQDLSQLVPCFLCPRSCLSFL